MLSLDQKEVLRDKVYKLLWNVGLTVENEQLVGILLKNGCQETPSGRIKISQKLIEEMAQSQKKTQAQDREDQELHYWCGIDWAHHIIWNKQQDAVRERLKNGFVMSAFDCGPTKYYDYPNHRLQPIDMDIFIEIKKFAQATPEIGYISTWYRQDSPPKIERIESLVEGLKYTDKLDGIEAIYPEVIKYLKDISEIITDEPGNSSYLAGSECITAPLILEKRSADDIIERFNCGVNRYHICSMPTIGVSTPVTIPATIVMMAAEIVGGMAVCYALDPEGDLSGRAIALVADMKTANNTASAPEVTAADLGVRELFEEWWGGHCWVEVYQSPSTIRPGLQAVYDSFCGQWRTSKILGDANIPYAGMGTLDCGATGSPTQFMLDMEIRRSQYALKDEVVINEAQLPFDDICKAVEKNDNFLSSDHTLDHFREMWMPQVFMVDAVSEGGWQGDEKALLDKCEQMWRDNLKKWEAPQWPAEKTRALENVLEKAKKDLL